MGFRDLFGRGSRRFWSEEAYRRALADQERSTPVTLERLADLGVSSEDLMKLEFFFYTDAASKGSALSSELAQLGYEVERRASAADKSRLVITGWTTPMRMAEDVVKAWIRRMAGLGFQHDCEFDGWGTSPGQ